jgi:hypothetical protein
MMNGATKRGAVVMLIVLLGFIGSAAVSPVLAFLGNPRVLPPHAHPHGLTYADWRVRWWQWADSIAAADNPILDQTGDDCGQSQSGSVWFLAGTAGGSVVRSCTVPVGKAILFPIITINNDFPCPDPNFRPAPGQSLEDFLTEGAQAVIDLVDDLAVEVDGVPLQNLSAHRATSVLFTFTGDPSLIPVFDPCITGTPQAGVSDGYWIMLAPLSRGEHTVRFRAGISSFGFQTEATYHLTISGR